MTWRKLGALVRNLPPESATATERRVAEPEPEGKVSDADPGDQPWSQTDLLLAAIVDTLRQIDWHYVSANSKTPPRAPEPLPRPGVRPPKRKKLTVAQYKALTGQEPPEYLIEH